ncbi:MAG TPA: phosphatidylinositol mannoside acyltransferase [Acidimicrobiia bacterium]|nr:phosphatidylinositol mannoside acyltransferase [Acidimicrobiia bacterium]
MSELPGYLALRAGAGLLSLLPASAARSLGRVGGRVWHATASGRRSMVERHMTRVLGDQAEAIRAARSVMQSYGRYYAEALWARGSRVEELQAQTTVEGLENIIGAREEGRGMIYGLPHVGNWEVAAPVSGNEKVPVVAVAENLPNRRITEWFTNMRADFGIEIVLATGGTEVMRKLEAALSANKAVALLSDRDLKQRGVEVVFFGEKTTLPPGPATLALRTGAPLLPVASYYDGDDGYRVVIRPAIPVPTEGPRSEKVRAMTQILADEMESLIRAAPRQWHLVQPNWPSDRE